MVPERTATRNRDTSLVNWHLNKNCADDSMWQLTGDSGKN